MNGSVILLKDAARIEGERTCAARLGSVELGPSPLPGNTRKITADYVRLRLRQRKFDPSVLAEDSSQECQITRASQTVSADRFIDCAIDFLKAQIDPGEDRLVIEPITRPQSRTLPAGTLKLVPELAGESTLSAIRGVTVHIQIDGESCGQVSLMLQIRRYAQVTVASKRIAHGELLTKENVKYVEKDRLSLPQDTFLQADSLEGLSATQVITEGMPITKQNAAEPPIIHRGDAITLQAKIGGICVTAPAIAMEDGRTGQMIRIKNTISNRECIACVKDSKTTEIPL